MDVCHRNHTRSPSRKRQELAYSIILLLSNLAFMIAVCPYCLHCEQRSCHSRYHLVARFFPARTGRSFAGQFRRNVAVVLALAQREGIHASPEQGMHALIARTWSDVDRIEVDYAGQNARDGRDPHVWFVSARVWIEGQERYHYPGSFFLHVDEGWVHVPEGRFPRLVGTWMELLHYNG